MEKQQTFHASIKHYNRGTTHWTEEIKWVESVEMTSTKSKLKIEKHWANTEEKLYKVNLWQKLAEDVVSSTWTIAPFFPAGDQNPELQPTAGIIWLITKKPAV